MSDMREAIARVLCGCLWDNINRGLKVGNQYGDFDDVPKIPREQYVNRFWGDLAREADALLPLIAQARREGAEGMRERAARVAEVYGDGEPSNEWEDGGEVASLTICQSIRSLPTDKEPT